MTETEVLQVIRSLGGTTDRDGLKKSVMRGELNPSGYNTEGMLFEPDEVEEAIHNAGRSAPPANEGKGMFGKIGANPRVDNVSYQAPKLRDDLLSYKVPRDYEDGQGFTTDAPQEYDIGINNPEVMGYDALIDAHEALSGDLGDAMARGIESGREDAAQEFLPEAADAIEQAYNQGINEGAGVTDQYYRENFDWSEFEDDSEEE